MRHSVFVLTVLLVLVFTDLTLVECRSLRSKGKKKNINSDAIDGRTTWKGFVSSSKSRNDINERVLAKDEVYSKMTSGPSSKGPGH